MREEKTYLLCLTLFVHACTGALVDEDASDTSSPFSQVASTTPPTDAVCSSPPIGGPALTPFRDEQELREHLTALQRCAPRSDYRAISARTPYAASSTDAPPPEAVAGPTAVARLGDRMFVLAGGRLYAVDVSLPGAPRQVDAANFFDVRVDPVPRDSTVLTELLIGGDNIFVIGSLQVDANGEPRPKGFPPDRFHTSLTARWIRTYRLQHDRLVLVDQTFIDEAGQDSASRRHSYWIDGALVFHLDGIAAAYDDAISFPRLLRYDTGLQRFIPIRPLFGASDVFRPLAPTPRFQTVVRCVPNATGALACSAKAVLAPEPSAIYPSTTELYWWTKGLAYAVSLQPFDVRAHKILASVDWPPPVMTVVGTNLLAVGMTREEGTFLNMWTLPRAGFDKKGEQSIYRRRIMHRSYLGMKTLHSQRFIGTTFIGSYQDLSGDLANPCTRVIYDVTWPDWPKITHSKRCDQTIEPLGNERALIVHHDIRFPSIDRSLTLELWRISPKLDLLSTLTLSDLTSSPNWLPGASLAYSADRQTVGLALQTHETDSRGNGVGRIGIFDVAGDTLRVKGVRPQVDDQGYCRGPCDRKLVPFVMHGRMFALVDEVVTELSDGVRTGHSLVLDATPWVGGQGTVTAR